jgi:hypothetical protein
MAPSKASSLRLCTPDNLRFGDIVRIVVTSSAAFGAEFYMLTQAISGAFYLNSRYGDFSKSDDTNTIVSVSPSNMSTLLTLGLSMTGASLSIWIMTGSRSV